MRAREARAGRLRDARSGLEKGDLTAVRDALAAMHEAGDTPPAALVQDLIRLAAARGARELVELLDIPRVTSEVATTTSSTVGDAKQGAAEVAVDVDKQDNGRIGGCNDGGGGGGGGGATPSSTLTSSASGESKQSPAVESRKVAPWLTLSASAYAQLIRGAVRGNPFKPWPARLLLNLVSASTCVNEPFHYQTQTSKRVCCFVSWQCVFCFL